MLSGRRLNLLEPSPFDIEIEDIALGLSRVCRWNGQTLGEHGFSVAQHSLLVLDLMDQAEPKAPASLRLAALLHDAGEYITSDLVTPFKAAVGPGYKDLERRIEAAVHLRFGLPAELPAAWAKAIKRADRTAAYLEATQVAGFAPDEARDVLDYKRPAPDLTLTPQPAEAARQAFLKRFRMLYLPG